MMKSLHMTGPPRSPAQQVTTGQSEEDLARKIKMRITRLLLLTLLILAIPAAAFAQLVVSVAIAPPALPVYVQPMAPDAGYLWTPGYWGYAGEGYFWVPG